MLSKVFPLKGDCGMGGGGDMSGGMSGGMCPICIPFFAQKDIKEF